MRGAPTMTEERSYTTKEVAEIINAHVKTVQRLIDRGELEAYMVGSQYRIRQSVLDKFMGKQPRDERSE